MLKQRIITALILVPLVLWALFGLTDDNLILLFSAILLVGTYEWSNLAGIKNLTFRILYIACQAFLLSLVWWLSETRPDVSLVVLTSVVLVWFTVILWLTVYEKNLLRLPLHQLSRLALGYILLPACLLGVSFILNHLNNDREIILLLFVLIWGADVAAYFSGKSFGKHKLASAISPGKTWEGVAGAILGTVVISLLVAVLLGFSTKQTFGVILFFTGVVVLSIAGDLFESLLKRQIGIKDSGNILPGHGGILDRIDSLIAASPLYALGIYMSGVVS